MDRAIRILYQARTSLPNKATVANLRSTMASAAQSLYGTEIKTSVECAFAAVGVGTTPAGGCSKTDILWRNTGDGNVAIWRMNGATVAAQLYPGAAGADWRIQVQIWRLNGASITQRINTSVNPVGLDWVIQDRNATGILPANSAAAFD